MGKVPLLEECLKACFEEMFFRDWSTILNDWVDAKHQLFMGSFPDFLLVQLRVRELELRMGKYLGIWMLTFLCSM